MSVQDDLVLLQADLAKWRSQSDYSPRKIARSFKKQAAKLLSSLSVPELSAATGFSTSALSRWRKEFATLPAANFIELPSNPVPTSSVHLELQFANKAQLKIRDCSWEQTCQLIHQLSSGGKR